MRELRSKTMTVFAGGMASQSSALPAASSHPVAARTDGDLGLIITVHSDMRSVERAWRLLEADPWNSMHQAYDWCYAWVKTHGNPLAIVEGRLDGTLAFILPLEIERYATVRTAQFIGSAFTNYNSGLFSADFRRKAEHIPVAALSAALARALAGRADLIRLTHVPLDWRGEPHPFAALPKVRNQNPAFQLTLGHDMDATIAPLNAKARRKKFRSQVRSWRLWAASTIFVRQARPTRLRFSTPSSGRKRHASKRKACRMSSRRPRRKPSFTWRLRWNAAGRTCLWNSMPSAQGRPRGQDSRRFRLIAQGRSRHLPVRVDRRHAGAGGQPG